MEEFVITLDDRKTGTKLIECKSKGLIVMVMPKKHRARHLSDHTIQITANFYDKSLSGIEMLEKAKHLDFWILNVNGPRAHEWTQELFFDAVDYYCNQYIKLPHDGLSIGWSLEYEAYCSDDVIVIDSEVDTEEIVQIKAAYHARVALENGEGANYDAAS
jgi:hypothetical protein